MAPRRSVRLLSPSLLNPSTCHGLSRDALLRAPIDIARPVLVANENLADEDLIEIINTKGSRHASAIATRKQISEAVADALVTSGDLAVMQVVAENLGARISGRAIDIMLIDAGRFGLASAKANFGAS